MSEKISSKKDDDISMRIDGNQNPYRAKEEEKVREMQENATAEPNAFAIEGAVAAFTKGEAWLLELRKYIWENKKAAAEFINENIPKIKTMPSEATYLMWINCGELAMDDKKFCRFIRKDTGLYVSEGSQYGNEGEGFMRMNVACPKSRLYDGLDRLKKGAERYEESNG